MGLKGYRLWVMGQLDSNVQRPTTPGHSVLYDSKNAMDAFFAASM
jgi:hypothetical protein